MKTFIKKKSGLTLIELVICTGLFVQMIIMASTAIMTALKANELNKKNANVNIELYGSIVNGIGAYIRKSSGIVYNTDSNASNRHGVKLSSVNAESSPCTENDENTFDTLSLYLDQDKKEFITFTVEKNEENNTSRLVWKKSNDPNGYYLNSEETYITCFNIAVSPDPYAPGASMHTKDIQPYITINTAARDRFAKAGDDNYFAENTRIAYQTTFTLRNYQYHKYNQ
jgi:hypothetical protein